MDVLEKLSDDYKKANEDYDKLTKEIEEQLIEWAKPVLIEDTYLFLTNKRGFVSVKTSDKNEADEAIKSKFMNYKFLYSSSDTFWYYINN